MSYHNSNMTFQNSNMVFQNSNMHGKFLNIMFQRLHVNMGFFQIWHFEKIPCQHGAPFPDDDYARQPV